MNKEGGNKTVLNFMHMNTSEHIEV